MKSEPFEPSYDPDPGQERKIKVVRPCLKVFWFSKGSSRGHSEGKRGDRQKKIWEDNIYEWTGMDFAQLGQLKTKQDGKGLLRSHLCCPHNLASLRID